VKSDDSESEYLTRSDIARILKISAKQAGRLMNRMPTVRVGRTHRRVLRADFDVWRLREREVLVAPPRETAIRSAARYLAARSDGGSGSVIKAAQALSLKCRLPTLAGVEEHTQVPAQGPAEMSPSDHKLLK